MNWFALTVKPQHEKAVEAQLLSKAIEGYAPVYRARQTWSDRIKTVELPLFPRYVFCRFSFDVRLKVLSTPSIRSIVSFCGKPAVVEDDEIAAIRTLVASGVPILAGPAIRVGERVRVCKGPLCGVEGILVHEKSGYRVVVNVEMLNRSVSAEIDRSYIEPVHHKSAPCN